MADINEKDILLHQGELAEAEPAIDTEQGNTELRAAEGLEHEGGLNTAAQSIPDTLPVLPVRDVVIFNYMILPLFIGRDKSVQAVDAALKNGRHLLVCAQKEESTEDPKPENDILSLQSTVLSGITNSTALARAGRTTLYGNSITPAVILNELSNMIFEADWKTDVNLYHQNLQYAYVSKLISMTKDVSYDHASAAAAYDNLKQLRSKLDKVNTGNEQTKAHRERLKFLIEKALVVK